MSTAARARSAPDATAKRGGAARLGVQAMETGVRLLQAMMQGERPAILKDLAARAGMAPPKALRYLVSACRSGLAVHHPATGTYSLGPVAIQLGLSALRHVDVVKLAAAELADIRDEIGCTTGLAIWGSRGPSFVLVEEMDDVAVITVRVGAVMPILSSATGRMYGAHMTSQLIAPLIKAELARARLGPPEGPARQADAPGGARDTGRRPKTRQRPSHRLHERRGARSRRAHLRPSDQYPRTARHPRRRRLVRYTLRRRLCRRPAASRRVAVETARASRTPHQEAPLRLLSTEAAASPQPQTAAQSRFDPFDAAYQRDPYAVLAELRASSPTFYSHDLGTWVVTSDATVRAVLRDPARFSASIASDPLKPLCPAARSIIQNSSFDVPRLLVNNDPPEHTRLRRFMGAPLQPARLLALEPFVRDTVREHVSLMAEGPRPVDLVTALTWDVPALVLFKLIGIPPEDVAQVKAWASSRVVLTWGRPDDEEQVRLAAGAVDYYHYAQELVRRKASEPADDYTSDLIRLRDGDDSKATLHEITVQIFNLLFAGHETTSSAAVNMFLALLRHPESWQAVTRGEVGCTQVVEEALRFDPPVQGWRRLVKEDVELDGQKIAAGSRLLLMFSAANHDPQRFDRPDEFCPGRAGAQVNVTFGAGLHFCMGAPLARQELAVMLEAVASQLPGLRMVEDQPIEYTPNTALRGARSLLVTW